MSGWEEINAARCGHPRAHNSEANANRPGDDLDDLLDQRRDEAGRKEDFTKYVSLLRRCFGREEFNKCVHTISKKRDQLKKGGYKFAGRVQFEPEKILSPHDVRVPKHSGETGSDVVEQAVSTPQRGRFYTDGNLPPQQRFFGREKEQASLSRAYRDRRTRVVIISGPVGGEGKSQLAQHWLSTEFASSRRALQIFPFSFNGQGTAETWQTSGGPFFAAALAWFKVEIDPNARFEEKVERLAHAIVGAGAILYLDGIEPLQCEAVADVATLRERTILSLLRHLMRPGSHFCVISTRYAISELQSDRNVRHIQLSSSIAPRGSRPFKACGVRAEQEGRGALLRHLARQWNYHPLSLVLLGSYLASYCEGDVRAADTIRELHRVRGPYRTELMLNAHERCLAESNQGALQLLRVLGLFDRPVDERWVSELTRSSIPRISDKLRSTWLTPDLRNATLKHLVDLGLISVKERFSSRHIYCHPLVQQYQGQSGRTRFHSPWRQAHTRLFRYFANVVQDPRPKTSGEMQTLYQAVAHGCAAGRYEKAFDEVYWPRISRETERFSTDALGLVAEDLACLASFFERPYSKLARRLDNAELGADVLSLAGFRLRSQGRLREAEFALKQALARYEELGKWEEASGEANNIAVLYRMRGQLKEAVAEGKKALEYAENSKNTELVISRMATLGEFHHYRGDLDEALRLFQTAEKKHTSRNPEDPFLHSTIGFRYCELLLTLERISEARERARNIPIKDTTRYLLLDRALSGLCEARALMAIDFGKRELSRAQRLLRESLELTKKSHHRDNQIRVTIALCECLRRRGQSYLPEAARLIRTAIAMADSDRMYLHSLDCEFEDVQIQSATQAPQHMRRRLRQLFKKAKAIDYGLLCMRIAKFLEIPRSLRTDDTTWHRSEPVGSDGLPWVL